MMLIKQRFALLRLKERIVRKCIEARLEARVLRAMAKMTELSREETVEFCIYDGVECMTCEKLLKQMGWTPKRNFSDCGKYYIITVENFKKA